MQIRNLNIIIFWCSGWFHPTTNIYILYRYLLYSLLIFFLTKNGYSQNKETQIVISTIKVDSIKPFSKLNLTLKTIETGREKKIKPPNMVFEYSTFKYITIHRHQNRFDLYREGYIDKASFLAMKVDTSLLSKKFINHRLHFFVGYSSNPLKRCVIVDLNNNYDFSDDKVFDVTDIEKADTSMKVLTTKLQYFDKERLHNIDYSFKFTVKPFKGLIFQDSSAKKLYLDLIPYGYRTNRFNINNDSFQIFIRGGMGMPIYNYSEDNSFNPEVFIDLLPNSKRDYKNLTTYDIGDTIRVNRSKFLIKSTSTFGENIEILYIGKDSVNYGFLEGQIIPQLKMTSMNNHIFDSKDLKHNYTILDFWGTWCQPCLKNTPKLRLLYEDYKDIALLGIAYEREENDLLKVKKYCNKNRIEWTQFVGFSTKKNNDVTLLIKTLKIDSFPTIILLDKEGKIVHRESGVDAIDKVREIIVSLLKK